MPRIKQRQDSEAEKRIALALEALHRDQNLLIRAAAKKYGVPRTTLTNRYYGRARPKTEAHEHQQLLTPGEETAIEKWISRLDDIGIPPMVRHLHDIVLAILRKRTSAENHSNLHIGDHWITRFLDRHPDIAYRYSARIENERAAAGKPETIHSFFNRLTEVRSRYHILPENTYNMDEKGFAIGQGTKQTKVLVRKRRKTSRIRQPGNREWVSVIECVSAVGKVLPAYLIYQGKSHLMGNHDYEEREDAVFGISDNGWSNDKHGFLWLSSHFEPQTRTLNHHRLLIIDGHSSHLSVEFIEFCLNHDIHLLCLPSHSTHLLQPLDVALFAPLKEYYSNELDMWTRTHLYQMFNKGDFFPLLMRARRQTFTEKNIRSAFTATGIFPFRRQQVLNILQHLSTLSEPQSKSGPATTIKEIQHLSSAAVQSECVQELKEISVQLATAASNAITKKATANAEKAIAEETIHQLLTAQKKSKVDKRQISKARVLHRSDLDRLRKERLEREQKRAKSRKQTRDPASKQIQKNVLTPTSGNRKGI